MAAAIVPETGLLYLFPCRYSLGTCTQVPPRTVPWNYGSVCDTISLPVPIPLCSRPRASIHRKTTIIAEVSRKNCASPGPLSPPSFDFFPPFFFRVSRPPFRFERRTFTVRGLFYDFPANGFRRHFVWDFYTIFFLSVRLIRCTLVSLFPFDYEFYGGSGFSTLRARVNGLLCTVSFVTLLISLSGECLIIMFCVLSNFAFPSESFRIKCPVERNISLVSGKVRECQYD